MSGNEDVYSSNELQGPPLPAEEEFLLKKKNNELLTLFLSPADLKIKVKCVTAACRKNTRTG